MGGRSDMTWSIDEWRRKKTTLTEKTIGIE